MQGQVVITDTSPQSGLIFGVRPPDTRMTFPVKACAVLLRGLKPGENVEFITHAETGEAIILKPEKKIGCRGKEREC